MGGYVSELTVLVRIGLYILAGRLTVYDLPPEVIGIITTDPAMVDLVSQAAAGLVALVAFGWWRIARWLGWPT